jgi:ABC-type multidrug transport system ATPase subunit/pSer/pThr/pTyr-binding forkhead associated (FHA) protein
MTHCFQCNASLGPRDPKCPRCGAPIHRQVTGTVLITRPMQAYLEIGIGPYATPRKFALQNQIPTYTIGRTPLAPGVKAPPEHITIEMHAVAVATRHAHLHVDASDPNAPICRFEDLGSPNGSFRNNRRFRQGILDDRDELWLGPVNGPTSARIVYYDPINRPPVRRWLLQPTGLNPLQVGKEVGPGHLRLFSESASDRHAVITRTPGAGNMSYAVSDIGSKNGTFVDNMRLAPNQPHVLVGGASLRFADCEYTVQRLDPMRVRLLPLGARSDEHVAGFDLTRTVSLEANLWVGEYIRYKLKRVLPTRQHSGGTVHIPPQRTKTLLHGVSAIIGPNDFVMLAGSSGSGKTTLMHILSTFIRPQSGGLTYKGQSYLDTPQLLRPNIGYVPQDDIVHDQLTVYAELKYAAQLRLPASWNTEERERRIQGVLKQLRLVPQTQQRINKLSGGQRKRLSIAVELLSKPGVLFLDEPTEGQDLALEQSIIIMLRNLSNEGTSVVLVSHRLNFLDYVDYVGWLSPGGHLVYFGPPEQVAGYFGVNPALPPARRYAAIYDKLDQERNPAQLAANFRSSPLYQESISARSTYRAAASPPTTLPVPPTTRSPLAGLKNLAAPKTTSQAQAKVQQGAPEKSDWMRQFLILFRRDWAVTRADWGFMAWMIVQAPLIGLLLYVLADPDMFRLALSEASPRLAPAQTILFALSVSAVWLGVFGSMRELVKERAIYRRERMVGMRLGPYLTSKIMMLSTFSIYQSIVLVGAVLLKAQPERSVGVFLPVSLEMFITVLLTSFGGMTLGLLLSALAHTQEVVGALVPLVVIPQFMLNKALGFSLGGIMDLLSKLTFTHWSLEALGDTAHLDPSRLIDPMTRSTIEWNGPDYNSTFGHLFSHWLMLAALSAAMLALTWVRQKRRDNYQG